MYDVINWDEYECHNVSESGKEIFNEKFWSKIDCWEDTIIIEVDLLTVATLLCSSLVIFTPHRAPVLCFFFKQPAAEPAAEPAAVHPCQLRSDQIRRVGNVRTTPLHCHQFSKLLIVGWNLSHQCTSRMSE